ncbi:hypothetical protein GCM10011315_27870 [Roseovarius pacificus]|nr:hypothetical protein GCM10011315_27870 [Roseovarius pacificus]
MQDLFAGVVVVKRQSKVALQRSKPMASIAFQFRPCPAGDGDAVLPVPGGFGAVRHINRGKCIEGGNRISCGTSGLYTARAGARLSFSAGEPQMTDQDKENRTAGSAGTIPPIDLPETGSGRERHVDMPGPKQENIEIMAR